MPVCPACGRYLDRVRRSFLQRPLYAVVYRCRCGAYRSKHLHPHVRVRLAFLFSRHTRCSRCGSPEVRPAHAHLDAFSRRPLNRLLCLLGATVYSCAVCRAQYPDWRAPQPYPDVSA